MALLLIGKDLPFAPLPECVSNFRNSQEDRTPLAALASFVVHFVHSSFAALTRKSLDLFHKGLRTNKKGLTISSLQFQDFKWSDLFFHFQFFVNHQQQSSIMTTIGRSERSERSALLGDVDDFCPVTGFL